MGKKKAMDLHNLKVQQNERRLFHGCPKDVAEKISHLEFNRSLQERMVIAYVHSYIHTCITSCNINVQGDDNCGIKRIDRPWDLLGAIICTCWLILKVIV